jgi:hypothetical protein
MKTYKVTLASGETRTIQADRYDQKEDFRSQNPTGFTVFTENPNPHEVLAVRTDEIVTIEEVTDDR